MRSYLDVQGTVFRGSNRSSLALALFGREEGRFWSSGLQYLKISAGARARVRPWLSLAAYYAHQDYVKTKPTSKHLVAADVLFGGEIVRKLDLIQRNEIEWHITDGYFRYRCLLSGWWTTPIRRLSVWGAGEFRVDADVGRVNMYNLLAGVSIRLSKTFRLRPFYGYEATRRGEPQFSGTHYLGLLLAVRG